MRITRLLLLSLSIILCDAQHGIADYSITGRVNLSEQWQPQIFLAAINKLDDYYNAYPDLLVDAAFLDEDGNFSMTGNNLPDEKKYYRLYLIKAENSEFDPCLHVGGDDHNFIHLILNSDSKLIINSDLTSPSPFGNYSVIGDFDNIMMKNLSNIVYPSFYFNEIKFSSELKLSQDKLNKDLINFADTCTSTIASLAAVINTDFDNYFEDNVTFYNRFSDKVNADVYDLGYQKDYQKKLIYYGPDKETSSDWPIELISFLTLIGLLSIFWNVSQHRRIKALLKEKDHNKVDITQLTSKEKQILELICSGKSNKEIASELFVELSTVKTHINKLYTKLNISNRNQAMQLGKSLLV